MYGLCWSVVLNVSGGCEVARKLVGVQRVVVTDQLLNRQLYRTYIETLEKVENMSTCGSADQHL